MSDRMFQITEDDLAALEATSALLYSEGSDPGVLSQRPDLRDGWKMMKEILSNVRWNYGPHEEVKIIPVD